MAIEDDIKAVADKISGRKDMLTTEEATKQFLVLPFLQALGYDVFDPAEVMPEFTADVGTKQGEKVDYAIISDNVPVMMIECKKASDNLSSRNRLSQLYRYFGTNAKVRIGVLTNGIRYQFFSDIESQNQMDTTPFLDVDLENLRPGVLEQLSQFAKGFDVDKTVEAASELKYINGMKQALARQYNQPEEKFVEWLSRQVYSGNMTQRAREKFSGLTRRAFHEFLSDRITATLRTAQDITQTQGEEIASNHEESFEENEEIDRGKKGIVTTVEELQARDIVKDIVQDVVDPERITLKDNVHYSNVILDDNSGMQLCRFRFGEKQKRIGLFDGSRDSRGTQMDTRHNLESLSDIYNHAEQIRETARRHLES